MVSGFNTNIRYRGVLFHVQSEASGADTPRILTHLFKGGDILASTRLACEAPEADLRAMMGEQHKSMLRALTRGDHDEVILARMGPDVFAGEAGEKGQQSDVTMPPPEPVDDVVATGSAASAGGAEPVSAKDRLASAFGDGVVSQKPLDEVVLDFLVDNARKNARKNAPTNAGESERKRKCKQK